MSHADGLAELPRTAAAITGGMAHGLHTGAQLFASIGGRRVADLAMGESREATIGRGAVSMSPQTIVLWLSSTKPVVAACILQLIQADRLFLDEPVVDLLPKFGVGGKESITIRHLLTHTCGFRQVHIDWPGMGWDAVIDRICQARLEPGWVVGERAGYHPFTSWFILGELVRIVSGTPLPQYVRQKIFEPLSMVDSWIGMPAARYFEYGSRIATLIDTQGPRRQPYRYANEQGATACIPGGNGHGPMRELAMFYEMLLGGGQRQGVRVLDEQWAHLMTIRQREGMMDVTFKHVVDWGLGTIIDSKRYGVETIPYGYGRYASDRTFGHGGSQSSVGFGDPAHGLAVGLYFNGMPGEPAHQKRLHQVLSALYEDLSLA